MAKNKVIAGDYQDKTVIGAKGSVSIITGFGKMVNLNQTTVESYEHKSEDQKNGTHVVSIEFKDGKKSLVEIDGVVYKALLQVMFKASPSSATEQGNINTNVPTNKKGCRKGCLTFIVLGIIAVVGIIILVLNMSKNPEKYDTSPKYDMVRALNITAEQAENAIKVFASIGINEDITIEHDEDLDNAHFEGEKGYRLSNRDVSNVILYMNADGAVYNIRYADNELYKEGKVISKLGDYVLSNKEMSDLQFQCQEAVKGLLKSPSTAKFPNILKWSFVKQDGIITVQSYVDAQNSFGAETRSEFQFKIKDGKAISLIFEGKEFIQQ